MVMFAMAVTFALISGSSERENGDWIITVRKLLGSLGHDMQKDTWKVYMYIILNMSLGEYGETIPLTMMEQAERVNDYNDVGTTSKRPAREDWIVIMRNGISPQSADIRLNLQTPTRIHIASQNII